MLKGPNGYTTETPHFGHIVLEQYVVTGIRIVGMLTSNKQNPKA